MNLSEERIRLIFGLKLRQLRMDKGLLLTDLATKAGLSISYLNEIEKGKKYPKTDKIALLANALDTPYDSLVSLKLSKQLAPLADLLNSNFLDEIPLSVFGISTAKVVEMMANAPAKVNAFISALMDIARNYNMTQKQFLSAALQSYQELHENYFDDLEDAVERFFAEFDINTSEPISNDFLEDVLKNRFNTIIDNEGLDNYPELIGFRALFIKGNPYRLLIDKNLSERQKKFLLAKEIGYHYLGLDITQRTYIYKSWVNTHTFDHALINFKASYFAGALLLPKEPLIDDISAFFTNPSWNAEGLMHILEKYQSTPETFMYRLTNLLPKFFNLHHLFFLRFNHKTNTDFYDLSKELHLSQRHNPHSNKWGEHYCRRWLSIDIFNKLDAKPNTNVIVDMQRSKYYDSKNEYLVISMARHVLLNPGSNISITIGLLINPELKRKIKFWDDETLPTRRVSVTCERCGITDCQERVAEPIIFEENKQIQSIVHLIQKLNLNAK